MEGFEAREKEWYLWKGKLREKSPYDSDDEYYMETWLQEALQRGLIKHYTFKPSYYRLYDQVHRRAGKKDDLLFTELIYTPDFDCTFCSIGEGILWDHINGSVKKSQVEFLTDDDRFAVIDVKPSYVDRYGSSRDFRYIQRLMYDRYGIYVNKTIILDGTMKNKFFAWTFVPRKYLLRNRRDGRGFLKVSVKTDNIRTSEQYLSQLTKTK
jgi:hypothetical protein